ncbi:hypothetical protein ACIPY5_11205 [Microbacterium sp. NPDC089698]|uniref:hypothetical protein n=1 Tax=Microbacterium sp. NPDC089698 TaxID=3364200 RepID=UPI0037F88326
MKLRVLWSTVQIAVGIFVALGLDPFLQKVTKALGWDDWIAGLSSGLVAAFLIALLSNLLFARPLIEISWYSVDDSEPLHDLCVELPSGTNTSPMFRVDVSVRCPSPVAKLIIWRLRTNGSQLRLAFPRAQVAPIVETPPVDSSGNPLAQASHDHLDMILQAEHHPIEKWTWTSLTFTVWSRAGEQRTDVVTQLLNRAGNASRYARIVSIDARIKSVRYREL